VMRRLILALVLLAIGLPASAQVVGLGPSNNITPPTFIVPASAVTSGGTALRPILFPSGVVGAPGISWSAETNSGWFRIGAGSFGVSVNGTAVQAWTSSAQ